MTPPSDAELAVIVRLAHAVLRNREPALPLNVQMKALAVAVLALAERAHLETGL